MKSDAFDQYWDEPKILGEKGMHAILDAGKKWANELASTLKAGGAAVFPHTFLSQCGYQIAACVHAVLDSGADRALVLGVLHPMSEALMQARAKELNDEDLSTEKSRGVFGPDLHSGDCWKQEFSLSLFKILFDAEVKRRGIKPPQLIERYPSLVNKAPEKLPGIKELEQIAKDAVIIATDDMFHHGVGYGVADATAMQINDEAYRFTKKYIEEGYELLKKNNFTKYFFHWMNPIAIGDPTDTTMVLKHLLGNVSTHILDLKLVDVSMLFENNIAPSWVAATLVQFKKA